MNEIEKTKKEIEVLTAKLELLKEMEKHKTPCEKAFKRVYGYYQEVCERSIWIAFKKGYDASQKDYKVGEYQPKKEKEQQIKELIRESVKWCEEHREESVEDYLRPKTPEQTEKSLKEAFVKAQQTEEWKETQRKIDAPKESWMNKSDEELVAMLEKNPPDCLKFVMGKTLEELICKCMVDYNSIIPVGLLEDILNNIEKWLPDFQSHEGTQSASVIDLVDGYNDALTKIKSKLRNKK